MVNRQGSVEKLGMRLPRPEFWKGRKVLVTGHTGFKGAWLAIWLHRMGAQVHGISLAPETKPNLYEAANIARITDGAFCDIRNADEIAARLAGIEPDIVFHLAAQALVLRGYEQPVETFQTNVMGTANVLNAIRNISQTRVAVIITTDKVYENLELSVPFREDDKLGGHDPYSASKAATEILVASFRSSALAGKAALSTMRAGNVMGGGDWSENRLIPDAVKAWTKGEILVVRNPASVRPWQHVLEPLAGYLISAEMTWDNPALAAAYNIGPDSGDIATVEAVIALAQGSFGMGEFMSSGSEPKKREAVHLALDNSRAKRELNVSPRWNLATTVHRTMAWYRQFNGGTAASKLCNYDIDAYETAP
jgi:CDP-glucose 4,6-dehydratase